MEPGVEVVWVSHSHANGREEEVNPRVKEGGAEDGEPGFHGAKEDTEEDASEE